MTSGTTRRGKAAGWATLIGVLGAVTGTVANGYVSTREIQERERRDAFAQAQLERSWEVLQGAVAGLREDARERDKDLDRLREAVAEMRGALTHLHRGRVERTFRGGAVERMLDAPKAGRAVRPVLELPLEPPAPEPNRVEAWERQLAE